MTIQAATPYLILGGRGERAIQFYQDVLGAKAEQVQRFGDVDKSCPEAQKNLIMHAELRAGSAVLMLSDGPGDTPPPPGGVVSVALALDDVAQARKAFDGLAQGGNVFQPLIDAPWGALFGVVTDQFGVNWMFNCSK